MDFDILELIGQSPNIKVYLSSDDPIFSPRKISSGQSIFQREICFLWDDFTLSFLEACYSKTRVGTSVQSRLAFWDEHFPGWASGDTPESRLMEAESCFFWGTNPETRDIIQFSGISPSTNLV